MAAKKKPVTTLDAGRPRSRWWLGRPGGAPGPGSTKRPVAHPRPRACSSPTPATAAASSSSSWSSTSSSDPHRPLARRHANTEGPPRMARILVLVEALDGTVTQGQHRAADAGPLARRAGRRRARAPAPTTPLPGPRHVRRHRGVRRRGRGRRRPRAGPKAEVLSQLADDRVPAAVLVPSTIEGKEIAARLAVRLGSGLITDAVEVAGSRPGSLPRKASSVGPRSSSPGWSRAPRSSPCESNSIAARAAPAAGGPSRSRSTYRRPGRRPT